MNSTNVNAVLKATLGVLASGANGFSIDEVSGYPAKRVKPVAEALVSEGVLFRSRSAHRPARYFSTKELSDSYSREQLIAPTKALSSPRSRATWAKDAPMHITAETKITVAPSPPSGIYRSNTYSR